jgi:hypothetical protein
MAVAPRARKAARGRFPRAMDHAQVRLEHLDLADEGKIHRVDPKIHKLTQQFG